MTWTALTYAFGSKLTSTKMTQNQDNFSAVCNKDAGAPVLANSYVVEAMLANGSVANAKIANGSVDNNKIASGAVTWGQISTGLQQSAAGGGSYTDFSFSGGARTLGWGLNSDTAEEDVRTPVIGGTYQWYIRVMRAGGGTQYFQASFINSSPPWDMGDGEIPLFIFLEIDSLGNVVRVDCADAPPWAYNGPTDLTASSIINNKKYRRVKQIIAEFGTLAAARAAGLTRSQILNRLMNDAEVDEEITQAIKNRDMGLISSPFIRKADPANTIVLLDPVSPLMQRLARLHREQALDEKLPQLFMDGRFNIGNTSLPRVSPPGVLVVSASLK